MSIRNIIYLIFSVLPLTQVFSQSDTETTATPAPVESSSAVDLKKERTNRLPITNPFFLPYQNQFFAELQGGWQRFSTSVGFPQQTISGLTYPESSSKTTWDAVRMGAAIGYGLHDRLTLGVELLYLASEKSQTTSTGIFTPSSNNTSPGFYNPRLSGLVRLLGLNRNDWFIDAGFFYMPGIASSDKNAFANPKPEIEGRLRLGRNAGAWTAGVAVALAYSFETTQNGVTYRSNTTLVTEGIIQYGADKYFAEAGVGLIQYVDQKSANDPLNGKMRTMVHFGIGNRFSENLYAKVTVGWLMPISADYRESGLLFHIEANGGPTAHVTVGFRF